MTQARRWSRRERAGWLVGTLLVVGGCTPPVGEGQVQVKVSGEESVRQGFPSHLLADGWSVRFTRYLVSVGEFTLSSPSRAEEQRLEGQLVVDLQKGEANLGELQGVRAGRWDVGFRVGPPGEGVQTPDGHVRPEDVERMRQGRYSYWLEGEAVKVGAGVFTFAMGFPLDVRMQTCTNGDDGTRGVVVPENSGALAEVSIHAEHMFYDRLGTHNGVQLRFEAFAAVAGADKVITAEELATQSLLDLRGMDGGELKDASGMPVVYQPGAFSVRTLLEFVTQSVADQAHLNGGGICSTAAP